MKRFATIALAMAIGSMMYHSAHASEVTGISPSKALTMLSEGNQRYVEAKATHPASTEERRVEVAKGQHPFAIILSCSDSRVPPELVYDQGLGDLFVVRVAGNITDPEILGSIEYAVKHLGASLIVVLGHERCGAVAAAVNSAHADGHVESLVHAIQPAVKSTKGKPGDPVDNAVRANIKHVVTELETSEPVLAHLYKAGKIKIVGERYDLDSGKAELIP